MNVGVDPKILRLKNFFLCGRQSHIGNLQEREASIFLLKGSSPP